MDKMRFKRIVAIICTLLQIFLFSTVFVSAEVTDQTVLLEDSNIDLISGEDNKDGTENTINALSSPSNLNPPTPNFSRPNCLLNESITVTFDNTDVTSCTFTTEGINVTQISTNTLDFSVTSGAGEYGKATFSFSYSNGEVEESSIYTYIGNGKMFINALSLDTAQDCFMKQEYDAGRITLDEWKESSIQRTASLLANDDVVEIDVEDNTSGNIVVSGRFRWETSAGGTKLPLRQTKVELLDKQIIGSRSLSTAYTDNDGHFSFTIDPDDFSDLEIGGLDLIVRCYTESRSVKVADAWLYNSYGFEVDLGDDITSSPDSIYKYIKYDTKYSASKAVYVEQGMVTAERFATEMGVEFGNKLNVAYPYDIRLPNSSYSTEILPNIYVCAILEERHNVFDTLMHEYGHYIQQTLDIIHIGLDEYINGTHSYFVDNFYAKDDKDFAMRLTWSESWATAFAQIAQEYYSDQYNGVALFADKMHRDHLKEYGFYFDFENALIGYYSCEAEEYTVTATLLDLYDSYNSAESFDNVSWGIEKWWDLTTYATVDDLTDFVTYIYTACSTERGDIGSILSHHKIAPLIRNATSSGNDLNAPPTIEWTINGSNTNPNNEFAVVVYDIYGNVIFSNESNRITTTLSYYQSLSYTIPEASWQAITEKYGGTFKFKIAVWGYHNKDGEISGPYFSDYAEYTSSKPEIELDIPSGAAANRYIEQTIRLDKGGSCYVKVRFNTSGYRLVQTFGTEDTKMSIYADPAGDALASNDDAGYGVNSLINYNFNAGVDYYIKVQFYSSTVYGDFRLAVTPAHNGSSLSPDCITDFDNVQTLPVSEYKAITPVLSPGESEVALFIPTITGNYTIATRGDRDMYLYLIDPTSSEVIGEGGGYKNDDSGEDYNAYLSVNLQAQKKYLIIYSLYNPASATSEIADIIVEVYYNDYYNNTINSSSHTHSYDTFEAASVTLHIHSCDCGYMDFVSHSYDTYVSRTESNHTYSCICGATKISSHSFDTITSSTASNHTKSCVCGASTAEAHTYSEYTYITNSRHSKECDCGQGILDYHTIMLGTEVNNHANCIYCDGLIDLRNEHYWSIAAAQKVTVNGSYITESGIVVLAEADLEAYENGTLIFYYPEDLPQVE